MLLFPYPYYSILLHVYIYSVRTLYAVTCCISSLTFKKLSIYGEKWKKTGKCLHYLFSLVVLQTKHMYFDIHSNSSDLVKYLYLNTICQRFNITRTRYIKSPTFQTRDLYINKLLFHIKSYHQLWCTLSYNPPVFCLVWTIPCK